MEPGIAQTPIFAVSSPALSASASPTQQTNTAYRGTHTVRIEQAAQLISSEGLNRVRCGDPAVQASNGKSICLAATSCGAYRLRNERAYSLIALES